MRNEEENEKMQTLIIIGISVFVIIGVSTIIVCVVRIFSERKQISIDDEIERNLIKLSENRNENEKAKAFISLMELSYVLVHTIINEGNKYNDKIQSKYFCEALTPQLINRLNTLEGKDEQYPF